MTKDGKARRTKRHIYAVAFDLFDERGFENVTVNDIAEAAEVGKRTFHRYFSQKEALFFDQLTFEGFVEEFRERLNETNSPERALAETYRNPRNFETDNSALAIRRRRLRALNRGKGRVDEYYIAFLDATERQLIEVIKEWQEANEDCLDLTRYDSYLVPGVWRLLSLHHVDSGEDHHYSPDGAAFATSLDKFVKSFKLAVETTRDESDLSVVR